MKIIISLTRLQPLLVSLILIQWAMGAFRVHFTVSIMNILNVVGDGFPHSFQHIPISLWSSCSYPVKMIYYRSSP